MAGVHAVNAVQLDVFRRYFEDVLHRLLGGQHFLHQLLEGGIVTGLIHGMRSTVLYTRQRSVIFLPGYGAP